MMPAERYFITQTLGYDPLSGIKLTGPLKTTSMILPVSRNCVFKRNQLPWFIPSLNTKMYFIVLEKAILFEALLGLCERRRENGLILPV